MLVAAMLPIEAPALGDQRPGQVRERAGSGAARRAQVARSSAARRWAQDGRGRVGVSAVAWPAARCAGARP